MIGRGDGNHLTRSLRALPDVAGDTARRPWAFEQVVHVKRLPGRFLLRPRMPELDCLRGLAILMVVFFRGFASRYQNGLTGFPKLVVSIVAPGHADRMGQEGPAGGESRNHSLCPIARFSAAVRQLVTQSFCLLGRWDIKIPSCE